MNNGALHTLSVREGDDVTSGWTKENRGLSVFLSDVTSVYFS